MQKCRIFRIAIFLGVFQLVAFSLAIAQSDLLEQLKFEAGKNEAPIKCGFPVILEAAASQDGAVMALFKQRRLETIQHLTETYTSPSGHFLIHYETSGPNAIPTYDRDGNGTPDYLEFVAKSFDRAWEVEIDSLGFQRPPDSQGNLLDTYPIFCGVPPILGGDRTYGVTFFNLSEDIPAFPGFNFPSEIWINIDFSFVPQSLYEHITAERDSADRPIVHDSLAIAVTAAHEFNHASQLGYRLWFRNNNPNDLPIDLWYIESSATYMEEVVAQEVNDYFQYLSDIFNSTDMHLTYDNPNDLRIYGEAVLHIMLGELYGKTITREVWEEIVNQPAIGSLDIILQQKGSDLNSEMRRWAAWMFFTGENALAGEFYPEAALYPDPDVIELDPAVLTQNPSKVVFGSNLPSLSFQLFKIPVVATGEVLLLLDAENFGNSWFGSQLYFDEPYYTHFIAESPFLTDFLPPSADIYIAVTSGDWDAGNTASPVNYNITLNASAGSQSDEVLVGPNPVRVDQAEGGVVTFLNLPQEAIIEIFSSNGLQVATVEPGSSGQVAQWFLSSNQGNIVGSGVYIYRVVSPEKSVSGKIMVIR